MSTGAFPTGSRDGASPSDTARALALLTGPDAGGLLAAAAAAAGGEVVSWRTRQVTARLRRGCTASYSAKLRWPDGRVTDETLAASTGDRPAGALLLDDGDDEVAVWRFPFDPDLPGLPVACDEEAVVDLFRELGFGGGPVRIRVRAYRPRRRAVIEAVGPRGRVFVKAVRPHRVEPLHHRHRLLVVSGMPTPQSLGWTSSGLLMLQALPGRTLRHALRSRAVPVPTGAEIVAMLDRMPGEIADGDARPSWLARVGHYAAIVAAGLPDQADRAIQIGEAIAGEAGTGPTVPVHGDFYENQLLVDGGRIAGVLDIDTAGPGERLDDLACLLAHLSVLAQLEPRRASATNRLGARYLCAFERVVDPVDLRYRIAAVVVSLATGPHRVQERRWPAATRRRLDLAERWLASARAAARAERRMTDISSSSHGALSAITDGGR
ncbi:MAG: phosphotransferase [Acidimicrobiales bacterium]